MGRHPIANNSNPGRTLDHVLQWVAYENQSRCWLALHFTPWETCALRYTPPFSGVKQRGTATCSETESFLDNKLREGVFRTFGFLKPKRLFSRIKLVTKNDLAPRRGYCWDHASSPKVLQEETASAEAVCTRCRRLLFMKLRNYKAT
jgi:hypothetical protein